MKTRLAIIGTGVAIATAGVITLLVVTGEPEEETTELAARTAALPELAKRDIEGGVVKPWDVKPPTAAELAQLAADQKAEAEELRAEEEKARKALSDAEAQSARQQAIEQARQAGVLGMTQLRGGAFASLTGRSDDDKNVYGGLLGDKAGDMNGGFGFGRSGFGPGGGGTGWGTIGTGNYGSIGRGSGTGYRGRVPTIGTGRPNATGDLDKNIIRRYIRRNLEKVRDCYANELTRDPKLAGTVTARFTISGNGSVAAATASGIDPAVSACIAGVIKGIEFPKPKSGGLVNVTYPFTFRPDGT